MITTGYAVGLGLFWIDGALATTLLVVQEANVGGEKAHQVLTLFYMGGGSERPPG